MDVKKLFANFYKINKISLSAFIQDKVFKLSASMAYSTIFAFPALLIVILGLSGFFLGKDTAANGFFSELKKLIGSEGADFAKGIIKNNSFNSNSILATTMGVIALLLSAAGIFIEMQDSIDMIWGVKVITKKKILKLIFDRLISFSMVLVLGLIFLVSLLINAAMDIFFHKLGNWFPENVINILYYLNYVIMFAITTCLFAFIFRALPDAKPRWKDVWAGAALTTVLFSIGKFLISIYLSRYAGINAYGAAGSILIILLWIYYSSAILYYGAEFTKAYIKHKNGDFELKKFAELVKPGKTGVAEEKQQH